MSKFEDNLKQIEAQVEVKRYEDEIPKSLRREF